MSSNNLAPPAQSFTLKQSSQAKSATSLTGLEQSIAPQTSPERPQPVIQPDQWKPLPPPPNMTRTESDGSVSRSPFRLDQRRSSSIYSNVLAAWMEPRWPAAEHQLQTSREAFYEANKSSYRASMSEPQLLLPRTYQPLLATPSSKASSESSPAPPLIQRPSELLPPPIQSPVLPRQHLHTISLATAQAMVDAPGSQHLLPEELRARRVAKARSTEHLPELSVEDKPQKPGSAYKTHESPTARLPSIMMFDAQTWHTFDPSKHKPSLSDPSAQTAYSTAGRHTPRKASYDIPTVGDAERGRSIYRTARRPSGGKLREQKTSDQRALEYAQLLTLNRPDFNEASPGRGLGINNAGTGVDDRHEFREPILRREPPLMALAQSQNARQQSPLSSVSPKHIARRNHSAVPSNLTTDSRPDSPPPPMFAFRDSDEQADTQLDQGDGKYSRTGSIPISPPHDSGIAEVLMPDEPNLQRPPLPPSPTLPSPPPPAVAAALAELEQAKAHSAKSKKSARESAYYPYIGHRRHKRKPKVLDPPVSMAPINSISPSQSSSSKSRARKTSDVPELISRVVHKAAQATDKIVRHNSTKRPTISKPILPDSPHLYPTSPAHLSQSVTAVYLGWSEESKEDFDASKPVSPKHHYAAKAFAPRADIRPLYEHIAAPARPLDERAVDTSSEQPTMRGRLSRSGSIFGSLLELRKEKGRERRREDIKRTIRVVPNESIRPGLAEKSASDADVPSGRPQLKDSGMGVWGRRLSEFGMI